MGCTGSARGGPSTQIHENIMSMNEKLIKHDSLNVLIIMFSVM